MLFEDRANPKDLLGFAPVVGTSYMTVAVRIAQHSTSPATHARRLVILPECAGEERHNQLPNHHPTYQKHGQSL